MTGQFHGQSRDTLTGSIVTSVAEHEGVEESMLPPLYETVDTDALEALFNHSTDPEDVDVTVTFQYAGCTVSVQPDGTVTVV